MPVESVANSRSFKVSTPSDREIALTRVFDAPRHLVFEPFPDAESVVTTVLTGEHGKTRMTVTASYPSKEVRDMVLKIGMERGAALSYDRLEEVAVELA